MKLIVTTILAYVFTCPGTGFAYEQPTHRLISRAATTASVLTQDPAVLGKLGLDAQQVFPNYKKQKATFNVLIQDGSEFEDEGSRATNHFYDPYHNVPASSCGRQYGLRSPDWTLEDQDSISEQDDSFADTRQFFLEALTKATKRERDEAWGRTFQGLGQVIHHLQDMAQPQHVRNDLHFSGLRDTIGYEGTVPCLGGPSLYELYTNLDTSGKQIRRNLPYLGYDPVYSSSDSATFNALRKFWHTNSGIGMADYTNRGFVSATTNFFDPHNNFPSPVLGAGWEEDKTALCQQISQRNGTPLPTGPGGSPLPCVMTFVETFVQDNYQGLLSGTNRKASTYSIFSAELDRFTNQKLYTLNSFNFQEAYPFLIPRAVGYSAGMINYFFRGVGKIDITPHSTQTSHLVIKNLSEETIRGTFSLYYDDQNGERIYAYNWPVDGGKLTISPQSQSSVPAMPFSPYRPDHPPQKPGEFLLVFKGEMGNEGASTQFDEPRFSIAVNTVTIPQSTFMTSTGRLWYANSYPSNGWVFVPDNTVQYGNVDWKGKGGTVSWIGPEGRYVHTIHTSLLTPKIFSNGQVLATAPGPVVGAAIQVNSTTQERMLIAVVATVDSSGGVSADNVYALSLTTPGSWRLIGTFAMSGGIDLPFASSFPPHYYFNESGTQAVTVKWIVRDQNSVRWNSFYANRKVVLDLNATNSASFSLGVPEPQVLIRNSGSLPGCWPYPCNVSAEINHYEETTNSIAADYIGDRLITLQYYERDVWTKAEQNQYLSTNDGYSGSSTETVRNRAVLRTSEGWEWEVWYNNFDYVFNYLFTLYEPIGNNQLDRGSTNSTRDRTLRTIHYLDLRFQPPLVTAAEYHYRSDFTREEFRKPTSPTGGPPTYSRTDNTTTAEQERLVWRINDTVYPVVDWRTISSQAPAVFYIGGSPDFSYRNTGETVGSFAAGGASENPQVVAHHQNPRVQYNFLSPLGDSSLIGSGPVGQ
jgi:hypothetical protein